MAHELGLRGLTLVSAGQPDIRIHYYLLVTVGMDAQVMGQFLPPVPEWGVPPFAPATQSLKHRHAGISRARLRVDVTQPHRLARCRAN